MADESFGDLNTIGQVRSVGRMGSMGGNDGRGPIDNVLPTGIVARGDEVRASEVMFRGQRSGMSVARNTEKKRMSNNR
jgi:hypothetical protein